MTNVTRAKLCKKLKTKSWLGVPRVRQMKNGQYSVLMKNDTQAFVNDDGSIESFVPNSNWFLYSKYTGKGQRGCIGIEQAMKTTDKALVKLYKSKQQVA